LTKETTAKRVLIVDDHPVLREGLAMIINGERDMTVCGEAEDVCDALDSIGRLRPDIAIIDLSLENGDGIGLIKDIRARFPGTRMLVLTIHGDSSYAERAIRAGAHGYVTKRESGRTVIHAARRVLAGEMYLNEHMVTEFLRGFSADHGGTICPVRRLSDREFEIFRLIGQGFSPSQIAETLHLSVRTVEVHRAHIRKKLTLKNASALRQYAIEWSHGQQAAVP